MPRSTKEQKVVVAPSGPDTNLRLDPTLPLEYSHPISGVKPLEIREICQSFMLISLGSQTEPSDAPCVQHRL